MCQSQFNAHRDVPPQQTTTSFRKKKLREKEEKKKGFQWKIVQKIHSGEQVFLKVSVKLTKVMEKDLAVQSDLCNG